jgi:hypothetical protein
VLPLRVERLDGARFWVTVFPPLPFTRSGEPHADTAAPMVRVNATLEAWIRDRPEQWLWAHRRWPDWPRLDQPMSGDHQTIRGRRRDCQIVMKAFNFARTSCATVSGTLAPACRTGRAWVSMLRM